MVTRTSQTGKNRYNSLHHELLILLSGNIANSGNEIIFHVSFTLKQLLLVFYCWLYHGKAIFITFFVGTENSREKFMYAQNYS